MKLDVVKRWESKKMTFAVLEKGKPMNELTPEEAYAVAEFIDMNIFDAIRTNEDWDSFHALRNLIHAYEKCCEISHFKGLTDQ